MSRTRTVWTTLIHSHANDRRLSPLVKIQRAQLVTFKRAPTHGRHLAIPARIVMIFLRRSGATLPLSAITPALLRILLGEIKFASDGARRSAMVKLKTILSAALSDGLIASHPMTNMKPPKTQKKVVDPFSQTQAEAILSKMGEDPNLYAHFYEFAFFTGMRPSEIMALRWEEINLERKTAYVCRIVSEGKIAERVKVPPFRHVLLNDRALHALECSRQESPESRYCFPTHRDGGYIAQAPLLHIGWEALLETLGIRYRPPYNARHTYATRCLMAGMKPSFIANQLGHSVEILLTTYTRWINSDQDWAEMEKLGIGPKLVQEIMPEPEVH